MQINFKNFQTLYRLVEANETKNKSDNTKTETGEISPKELYLDLIQNYINKMTDINLDDETLAEIDNTESELYSAKAMVTWEMKELQLNQQAAQTASSSAFVKMITDTTDLAGHEIFANFLDIERQFHELKSGSIPFSDIKSRLDEIKSAIEECLCKLEIQLTLSNAALSANSVIEQMKEAGVDDSEIRELFENYADNMDTSIAGKTQFSKKTTGNKNVSLTADDKEIDKKINDLKRKINEQKNIIKSKTASLQERQQAQVKLEGYMFLIDTYSSIKKALSKINKSLLDIFK